MKIFYRISDVSQDPNQTKRKIKGLNNETCLRNFTKVFSQQVDNFQQPANIDIYVIADNVCDDTYNMVCKYVPESNIQKVSEGNGAATFRIAFNQALQHDDNEIIYFVENDYLHKPNSYEILLEGFSLGFPYVTLYDHPDKYMKLNIDGSNPLVDDGAEKTKVYRTASSHWKITNATTMTFAAKVKDLKIDEPVIRRWTSGIHPHDFFMFLQIQDNYFGVLTHNLYPNQWLRNKRHIICPIPGYSTHGDIKFVDSLTDWGKYVTS